jgi:predicted nucleic acid-binding protein
MARTAPIALDAARTSVALAIPMADSIILATARLSAATLWTQDSDSTSMEGVKFVARREPDLQ